MFCSHCGVEYPGDSQFCRKCGNAVTGFSGGGLIAAALAMQHLRFPQKPRNITSLRFRPARIV